LCATREIAERDAGRELIDDPRPPDQRHICARCREFAADPDADQTCSEDRDHAVRGYRTPPGIRAALPRYIMKEEQTALATRNPQQGKAGYALAWLLGVPLPLLLVIYLFSRAC
jgi:hypothetical protein